jgi:hypothetical protein
LNSEVVTWCVFFDLQDVMSSLVLLNEDQLFLVNSRIWYFLRFATLLLFIHYCHSRVTESFAFAKYGTWTCLNCNFHLVILLYIASTLTSLIRTWFIMVMGLLYLSIGGYVRLTVGFICWCKVPTQMDTFTWIPKTW